MFGRNINGASRSTDEAPLKYESGTDEDEPVVRNTRNYQPQRPTKNKGTALFGRYGMEVPMRGPFVEDGMPVTHGESAGTGVPPVGESAGYEPQAASGSGGRSANPPPPVAHRNVPPTVDLPNWWPIFDNQSMPITHLYRFGGGTTSNVHVTYTLKHRAFKKMWA